MRKKFINCLLFATLTIFASATLSPYLVNAIPQHDIHGEDYSYNEALTYGDPWYCECNHRIQDGDPNDAMAGLSLTAKYAPGVSPREFYWAQWAFEGQYGTGDISMMPSPYIYIDPCVNGYDHHSYYYYATPVYGVPPLGWFNCYYIYYEINSNIYDVTSVEAQCHAIFYQPSDPPWPPIFGPMFWLEAHTQNPPGQSGQGWSFINAHD